MLSEQTVDLVRATFPDDEILQGYVQQKDFHPMEFCTRLRNYPMERQVGFIDNYLQGLFAVQSREDLERFGEKIVIPNINDTARMLVEINMIPRRTSDPSQAEMIESVNLFLTAAGASSPEPEVRLIKDIGLARKSLEEMNTSRRTLDPLHHQAHRKSFEVAESTNLSFLHHYLCESNFPYMVDVQQLMIWQTALLLG